jgi:hypothetical protein
MQLKDRILILTVESLCRAVEHRPVSNSGPTPAAAIGELRRPHLFLHLPCYIASF